MLQVTSQITLKSLAIEAKQCYKTSLQSFKQWAIGKLNRQRGAATDNFLLLEMEKAQ